MRHVETSSVGCDRAKPALVSPVLFSWLVAPRADRDLSLPKSLAVVLACDAGDAPARFCDEPRDFFGGGADFCGRDSERRASRTPLDAKQLLVGSRLQAQSACARARSKVIRARKRATIHAGAAEIEV